MGIYVSEITMPKGEGSKLVLQIFPNGEVYDGHGIRLGITNWAEAVPVLPHGRLIDADALYEDCALDHNYEVAATTTRINEYMQLKIDDAPTIIPAERKENKK